MAAAAPEGGSGAPVDAIVPDVPVEANSALQYAGRVVAFATVAAPNGGLGDENLDGLLRVRQDRQFHPMDVRQDIATLFRAGDFAQVVAFVEPWPVVLVNGDQIEGVRVEYRVTATPIIRRLGVNGFRSLGARVVLGRVGLAEGERWRIDDSASFEQAIVDEYRDAGWPEAKATVARTFDEDGDVELEVTVLEGNARRLAEIKVRPNEAVSTGRARQLLRKSGVVEGQPFTDAKLRAAQDALLTEVRSWRPPFLWWKPAFWPEARVNLKLTTAATGGDQLSVLIEPQRRYEITLADPAHPAETPSPAALVELMGLGDGARLGRDFADEASLVLSDEARREGYAEAKIEVRTKELDERVEVTIDGERGPRYALRAVRARGDVIDPNTLGSNSGSALSGCIAGGPRRLSGEGPRAAAARARGERFLCQATAESAREVISPPVFGRQTITPELAERAAGDIEEFYRSQGYLGVRVETTAFEALPGGTRRRRDVAMTLEIATGARVELADVVVTGAAPGVEGSAYYQDLIAKPLNPATLKERGRRLVEAHQELGFLHADSETFTTLSGDGTAAVARVEVVPGPLVLIRSVLIRGHARTRRSTVEREVLVSPGDAVAPAQLAAIRRSLYELGVFQRVSVDATGDEDRVKDVIVTLEEKKNLAFEVGGGVATDNGAAVFARAGHRNLWGLAHRLTLYGRAGVGWVGDGWNIDWLAPEWRVALRYEAPNLPTHRERVAIDLLLNENEQERSFRIRRSGGSASVRLSLATGATAELGYRVQARTLYDIDPGVLVSGDAWLDELGVTDLADPTPITPSSQRFASGISAKFVFDARDDVVAPTRGGLGSLAVDVNDDIVSDVAFLRAEGGWTQLIPVSGLGLIFRVRGGGAITPNDGATLPIEDRLRAGGGGSFRGFDIDEVGPANLVSAEDVSWPDAIEPAVRWSQRGATGRWVPTGGDLMGVGTAEIDVPFPRLGLAGWSSWQLAFFTDIGNVWWANPGVTTDSMSRGTDPTLRYSVGVGIRRSTPIGPLQLDLGLNPSPLEYRAEELVRIHFAVGAL